MNELDLLLEELEQVQTHETILDSHLQICEACHCDLFESGFYREFWADFQCNDNSMIGSTIEQLVNSLRP